MAGESRRPGRPARATSPSCSAAPAPCAPTGTSSRARTCSSRQRRQPHRLRPAGAGRRPPRRGGRGRHAHGVPRAPTVRVRDRRGAPTAGSSASRRSPPHPAQRPGQRRHLRLRTRACSTRSPSRRPRDIGFDLLPRLVGPGRRRGARRRLLPRHRHAGGARARPPDVDGRVPGMIITQTPLRVGLVGGGTDLPDYYREHGGRVLNAAIDKYVYVVVKQRFDDDIYVNYSQKEIVSRVEDLQHELVREALHMTGDPGRGRDHHARGHPVRRLRPRLVVRGHRRPAAGAVRLPGPPAHRRGAGRPGLRHRDRPLPQADRQAGPVRRGVRRRLRHPLRPGRPGASSTSWR